MKRILNMTLLPALLALVLLPFASAQNNDDLADFARQQREHKQATTKVYDNDNMPNTEHISVVGSEPPAPAADSSDTKTSTQDAATDGAKDTAKADANSQGKKKADDKPAAIEPGQSPDERKQAYDDWQSRIKEQKEAVDLAQRELDVTQREYRLRTAVVANDVGYRLRNSADWDKQDKHYKEEIAAKQKTLDEAQKKLSELQEQARKAGVPTKVSQ